MPSLSGSCIVWQTETIGGQTGFRLVGQVDVVAGTRAFDTAVFPSIDDLSAEDAWAASMQQRLQIVVACEPDDTDVPVMSPLYEVEVPSSLPDRA